MKKRFLIPCVSALCLFIAGPVFGAEVLLHYSAIEKMLNQEVFTRKGRHYLFGSEDTPCLYATLSRPRVSASGKRLRITLFFDGMLAQELAYQCVGLSDEFDLDISGIPSFQDGTLTLRDVQFTEASQVPQFNEHLNQFITTQMEDVFRQDLTALVQRLIAENRDRIPYDIDLADLDIPRLEVRPDRLALTLNFTLIVR